MAQDFERNAAASISNNSGSPTTIRTSNGDDAIVGINVANKGTSQITITILITKGSDGDFIIIKDAPIPVGSSLQVLDGGAKLVMQNNDVMKAYCSTASSADIWVSAVDDIST